MGILCRRQFLSGLPGYLCVFLLTTALFYAVTERDTETRLAHTYVHTDSHREADTDPHIHMHTHTSAPAVRLEEVKRDLEQETKSVETPSTERLSQSKVERIQEKLNDLLKYEHDTLKVVGEKGLFSRKGKPKQFPPEKKPKAEVVDMRSQTSGTEKAAIDDVLSRPVINMFNISYIYFNENKCGGKGEEEEEEEEEEVEVLFVVPSAPNNAQRRSLVRRGAQFAYAQNSSHKAKVLFFTGLPHKTKTSQDSTGKSREQRLLEEEARLYGDMVLVNFEDIYRNILIKHVAMLKWVLAYCPQTAYVIRTDDDVVVNPQALVSVLRRFGETFDNFILGRRRVNDVVARVKNKYYISREEYPPARFPPYVLGGCIGYPLTTVHLLYETAKRIKTIWLDDVFITGLCAKAAHIPNFADPDFLFKEANSRWN